MRKRARESPLQSTKSPKLQDEELIAIEPPTKRARASVTTPEKNKTITPSTSKLRTPSTAVSSTIAPKLSSRTLSATKKAPISPKSATPVKAVIRKPVLVSSPPPDDVLSQEIEEEGEQELGEEGAEEAVSPTLSDEEDNAALVTNFRVSPANVEMLKERGITTLFPIQVWHAISKT